jgi:Protein of unknown function (DUF4236)
MRFRFYRRVRILPGVRLNLSKGGASVSMGPKGATLTLGQKGIRATAGLTGTGMYWTEQAKWRDLAAMRQNPPPTLPPPRQPQYSQPSAPSGGIRWGWIIFCAIIVMLALAGHH